MLSLQSHTSRTPQPWKNKKGVCYDILTHGEKGAADFWEIGTADLTQDAPFSDFTGTARQFCVAEGTVQLLIDGRPHFCPVLSVTHFSGAAETSCMLERGKGPAKALNLLQSERAEMKLGMKIVSSSPSSSSSYDEGVDMNSCDLCVVAVGGAASVSVSCGSRAFAFELSLLDALLWTEEGEGEGKGEKRSNAKLVVRSGSVAIVGQQGESARDKAFKHITAHTP